MAAAAVAGEVALHYPWFRVLWYDTFLGGSTRRQLRAERGTLLDDTNGGNNERYVRLYTYFAPIYCLYLPMCIVCPQCVRYVLMGIRGNEGDDNVMMIMSHDTSDNEMMGHIFVDTDENGDITFREIMTNLGHNLQYTQELFTTLAFTVVPAYYLALHLKQVTLFDLYVVQRVCIVGPAIVVTVLCGQTVDRSYTLLSFAFVFDVVVGFVHGFFAPGGYAGIRQRLYSHWRNSTLSRWHSGLRAEAYVGGVFGLMSTAWASVCGTTPLLTFQIAVATILQYMWIWHASLDQTDRSTKHVMGLRIYWMLGHVIMAEWLGVGQQAVETGTLHGNLGPLRWMYASLFLGLLRPRFGTIGTGIGTLYLYVEIYACLLIHDQQEQDDSSNMLVYWMLGWSVIHVLVSQAWKSMFFIDYSYDQQVRVTRTMWQDRLTAVFLVTVAALLNKGQALGLDSKLGVVIGYTFPVISLWYQTQCKLLTHFNTGTPFHPSWWSRRSSAATTATVVPKKYSTNEVLNLSFSVATMLMTMGSTTLATVAMAQMVGPDRFYSLGFYDNHDNDTVELVVWKCLAMHGMFLILTSGGWMVLASSGVPAVFQNAGLFRFLALPPLLKVQDPHGCITVHWRDLLLGHGLLLLAVFAPTAKDLSSLLGHGQHYYNFYQLVDDYYPYALGLAWAVSLGSKVHVHMQTWRNKKDPPRDPQQDNNNNNNNNNTTAQVAIVSTTTPSPEDNNNYSSSRTTTTTTTTTSQQSPKPNHLAMWFASVMSGGRGDNDG